VRRAYVIAQLLILVCFYVAPYTLLSRARGLELYAYWTLSTIMSGVLALMYLWWRGRGEER